MSTRNRMRRESIVLTVVMVWAGMLAWVGPVIATDTDFDGMSDAYELFFGLNPTNAPDAALDYDADTLTNLAEAVKCTDPYAADTDRDGFNDNVDSNAISRAYIRWGDPKYTTGDRYDYAAPDWFVTAYKTEGEWQTNPVCWRMGGTNGGDTGRLIIEVDRALLTNNLALEMVYDDRAETSLYVDLADSNGIVLATNLYGNLMTGSNAAMAVTLNIPLTQYPVAMRIQMRRGEGEVSIYESLLYIDEDGDGLDADQERQLGTSDYNKDSDSDGIGDYDEVFRYGTDPAKANKSGDGIPKQGMGYGGSVDSDMDGIPDDWEYEHGMDTNSVSTNNLVGLWRLDETNGVTAYDISTNANHGTITGAVWVATGRITYARQFDGTNDAIVITNSAVYKPTNLTVLAYTRFEDLYRNVVTGSVAEGHMVVLAQRNAGTGYGYAIYKTDQHALAFEVAKSASATGVVIKTPDGFVTTGQWYHVAGVVSGTGVAFYVNSRQIGQAAYTAGLEYCATQGLVLGHGGTPTNGYFRGSLDDVRIYNITLSSNQVASLHQVALDTDGDDLTEWEEYTADTDPDNPDTDSDGISDADEKKYGTNPLSADTDGDGLSDWWEVEHGLDPCVSNAISSLLTAYLDRNYYSTETDVHGIAVFNVPATWTNYTAELTVTPTGGSEIVATAPVTNVSRMVVTMAVTNVPLGTNAAVIAILDAWSNVVASVALQIRREVPATGTVHEVKVDQDNLVALVDGAPFFPIGVHFDAPTNQLQIIKDAGFNCVVHNASKVNMPTNMTPEERRAASRQYLDYAQAIGLKVLEWPLLYTDGSAYVSKVNTNEVANFITNRFDEILDYQKDHPALLAYCTIDEPNAGDVSLNRAFTAAMASHIVKRDPYHPSYTLFGDYVQNWPECMDMCGADFYPIYGSGMEWLYDIFTGVSSNVVMQDHMRKPLWFAPQFEEWSCSVRSITPEEQRVQTYLSVIGGAKGIIWFIWPARSAAVWQELTKLAGELGTISPALTTAIPAQSVVYQAPELQATIKASIRVSSNGVYLITCNVSDIPIEVDFTLENSIAATAEVLFEGRQVSVQNGVIHDHFAGYQTHVYRWDGSLPAGETLNIKGLLGTRPELASPSPWENLLVSGGMEDEKLWCLSSYGDPANMIEISKSDCHSGKQSLVLDRNNATQLIGAGWSVRLAPHSIYRLGCYARTDGDDTSSGGLGLVPSGLLAEGGTLLFRHRDPAWGQYERLIATGDRPISVAPEIFHIWNGTGTAWIDDVYLCRVATYSRNLLRNSGFEQNVQTNWPENWWTATKYPAIVGGTNMVWGTVTNEAYEGTHSMRLVQSESTIYMSCQQKLFMLITNTQPMTCSAYMKAMVTNTPVRLMANSSSYPNYTTVYVGTNWSRYAYTLTLNYPNYNTTVYFTMQGTGTVWIDAVQFEKGTNATDYEATAF